MEATPNEHAERVLERLLKALRGAMADRGVKFYADEIGIGHATLLHKLEPDNPGDMLTLRQFARLLVRLPAGEIMRPLAAELGGVWFTAAAAAEHGADLHRLMNEAGGEFGDISRALLEATDPDGPAGAAWTDEELDRLTREVDEAAGKFRQIVATARRGRVVSLAAHRRA